MPLAIILHCAVVPHTIRTAPSTHQTGVLLAQNYFSSDSTVKEIRKDKWRKQLKQMGAFTVPEKAENLKKKSIRWRKIPNPNLGKLKTGFSQMPLRAGVGHVTVPQAGVQRCSYGKPSISPPGDRDREGQR